MGLVYVYAGNFPLRGTFTEQEADEQIAQITYCVENVRKVAVDDQLQEKPKLTIVEGGRK